MCSYDLPSVSRISAGNCPVTMVMNGKKCVGTVSHGEQRTLQAPESDISVYIPEGSDGLYLTKIHTDHSVMRDHSVVPDDECVISAVVEVQQIQQSNDREKNHNRNFFIKMPHCVPNEESLKFVKVRKGNMLRNMKFEEFPRMNATNVSDCFTVDSKFITIHTKTFSVFVCTICKNVCQAITQVLLFGGFQPLPERQLSWVKLKSFFCCPLLSIKEFAEVS